MATIATLEKQIAALRKQADALRKTETAAVIKKVKALVAEHGLSAEDLGMAGKTGVVRKGAQRPKATVKSKASSGKTGVAKYQDPSTGKTWTGTGKPPAWIAGAANREAFLIAPSAAMPAPSTEAKSARRKPAAKKSPKTQAPGAKAAAAPAKKSGRSRKLTAKKAPAATPGATGATGE